MTLLHTKKCIGEQIVLHGHGVTYINTTPKIM